MRSKQEMMKLIIDFAKDDERIRVVTLTGSRVNEAAPADCFQDFDIMYVVRDLQDISSFICNHSWIDRFGKRIMLQMPELNRNPVGDGHFAYLMLFADGNRLDLTLIPAELFKICGAEDSEDIILLDKDGIAKDYPPVSVTLYHIKPPSESDFQSCCNNFWWCSQNVAKGIWRDELSYAMFMYDRVIRDEFHSMIEWYIGTKTNFSVSAGKLGKYFKKYLDIHQYKMYCETFTNSNYENLWNSMFIMFDLFRELAQEVAARFDFIYQSDDDKNIMAYLKHIRALPKETTEIY